MKSLIPLLGFGTYELRGKFAQNAVESALKIGYRHIDTAEIYGNQREIGKVIQSSGINRNELFITSKVWHTHLKKDDLFSAFQQTIDELQTDYLDLYLIHWPNRQVEISETLEALNKLKSRGKIKLLGVSNFTIHHLKDALKTGIEISNNQFELHPSLYQKDLVGFCKENNIAVTAYSPIAQGRDLKLESVRKLSEKYSRSSAQIILNWLRQKDIIAIPRSANLEHISDNFKSLEWDMEFGDVKMLDILDSGNRIINPRFGDFDY